MIATFGLLSISSPHLALLESHRLLQPSGTIGIAAWHTICWHTLGWNTLLSSANAAISWPQPYPTHNALFASLYADHTPSPITITT
ncbi:hypothetical protein K432DRAFT_385445 [Lepidopterella palustris CBS 459.81]|uniref:Uncharacterized protein n=1 Tax=Lepidopterella palustris CBS 459.81 TaxID=1314670 RepID=A0A8E2JBF3_9PEZI|nr:hypothetical protein K432DRAFT_385445 [Lepidopterella palustris CBS 459.81]